MFTVDAGLKLTQKGLPPTLSSPRNKNEAQREKNGKELDFSLSLSSFKNFLNF